LLSRPAHQRADQRRGKEREQRERHHAHQAAAAEEIAEQPAEGEAAEDAAPPAARLRGRLGILPLARRGLRRRRLGRGRGDVALDAERATAAEAPRVGVLDEHQAAYEEERNRK
jgi:hypothetical protein